VTQDDTGRKLRIFYVAGKGYHDWAFASARQLQSLGHDVTILCDPDPRLIAKLTEDKLRQRYIVFPQKLRDIRGILRAIGELRQVFATEKPDVVYHYMIPISFWSRIAAWLSHVPVRVYKPASLWDLDMPLYRTFEFCTAWMDNVILASSQALFDIYSKWWHTAAHTHLSYLGLSVENFNPVTVGISSDFRRELSTTAQLVGLIAYLYPPIPKFNSELGIKGHEILIWAAKDVVRKRPNVKFVLVGDEPPHVGIGVYRHKLEQMVSDLGLSSHFVFTGARQDIPNILSALDLVVMPSLSEGLGLATVEALLMCKPVVASKVGSLPEFIIDGETGLLVPPANVSALAEAVLKLLEVPDDVRKAMGLKGRMLVSGKFDIRQVVSRELALYRQALYQGG
jgi:glycosyltransferase involved in cell wall biosynthesis